MKQFAICLLLSIVTLFRVSAAGNNVFCYYGSWAFYHSGVGSVSTKDLDPTLCTHIIYAFVGVNETGNVVILDPYLEIDNGALQYFVKLKERSPNVKVMPSIGGWSQGGRSFSLVAASATLRTAFVNNVVVFMMEYGFDGFDVDWLYPGDNGGRPGDKSNFILLLKELRAAFDYHKWILTVAVGASKSRRESSYDVQNINKYADFIHVLAFDLHGSWDGVTGHHAPLSASYLNDGLYIKAIISEWLNAGASASKLNLGLAFYARTFTLKYSNNHSIGAPTTGPGKPGTYTQEAGALSYLEICTNIKNKSLTVACDYQGQVPYAYGGNQWAGFDNRLSLEKKVDYVKSQHLSGVAIWSIDHDDVHNQCGDGRFPLLKAVYNRINSHSNLLPFPRRGEMYC